MRHRDDEILNKVAFPISAENHRYFLEISFHLCVFRVERSVDIGPCVPSGCIGNTLAAERAENELD